MRMLILLISHHSGFPAFEDYCLGLQRALHHASGNCAVVEIVVYEKVEEIPIREAVYWFVGWIPDPLLSRPQLSPLRGRGVSPLRGRGVYLSNTEQLTRKEMEPWVRVCLQRGITVFDYDLYQSWWNEEQFGQFGGVHRYLPY